MKRRNDDLPVRLPEAVVEKLNTKGIPRTATAVIRSDGADMPLTTRGIQEVAARLRAEREVFEESQKLDQARGDAASVDELTKKVRELEAHNKVLREERDALRSDLTRSTAASALAVHGEGSQR
jgi:hypothetical protein